VSKGKSETSQEGFNLLEDTQQQKVETAEEKEKGDIYNLLGSLKLPYVTKKSKNGKINLTVTLQNKEQLSMLIANVSKIQNALNDGEYVVTPIASRNPYNLVLVITKDSAILKISYLSGFIKNVNMSIPVSQTTINALQAILNALASTDLGKKLLSVSTLNTQQQSTENLL